jgi:HEAT repeat protein
MRKRFLAWVGLMLVVIAGVVFGVPGSRYLALGYLNREPIVDSLPESYHIHSLKSPQVQVRARAAFDLGILGADGRKAVPALSDALHDDDGLVRVNAALALYKIGPEAEAAVPALSDALGDDVPLVRLDAAMALFRIGPRAGGAVPALLRALHRDDNHIRIFGFYYNIREQVARTLGRIGPGARAAVPDLCAALADDELEMRVSATEALRDIDPEALKAARPAADGHRGR